MPWDCEGRAEPRRNTDEHGPRNNTDEHGLRDDSRLSRNKWRATIQEMGLDTNLERLGRVRRRHDHIDAVLSARDSWWELRFLRNDRLLLALCHELRETARVEAAERLRELQRAGWNTHW